MKQRVIWHISFWMVYSFAYASLSTSFPSPSDMEYSLAVRFLRFCRNEWLMMPLKWIVTYSFIYWIVPAYFIKGKYWQGLLLLVCVVTPVLFLNRFINFYVAYPLMYGEYPTYELISVRRLLYVFLGLASAVGAFSTLKLLKTHIIDHRREQALIQEKLQSELNFLRAQTNPHFLFNTLNNIYALARKQSTQTAPVVMKLSQMLRFMLYECTKPRISLEDELRVIEDYIELEKLRYNDRLKVRLHTDIDEKGQMIAPLLILPLVENAFKHGASESRFETYIYIDVILKEHILKVEIKNSKEQTEMTNSEGIGLANVRRQLELIYPDMHHLEIEDENDFYRVHLEIALI